MNTTAKRLVILSLMCGTSLGFAQDQCILAGRLNTDGGWAPRFAGVGLLSEQGQSITRGQREALSQVKQVRLSRDAVLTACNGNQALAKGEDIPPTPKAPVPAVKAGKALLEVNGLNYLPLGKVGGELVEIRLATVPAERLTQVSR